MEVYTIAQAATATRRTEADIKTAIATHYLDATFYPLPRWKRRATAANSKAVRITHCALVEFAIRHGVAM
ncbi:MAG: hypothetical protein AAFX06_19965 [Planctomycetota bacterium]